MKKSIVCLLLALCMTLSLGLAMAETTKEEVVYAVLDASGAPGALYAVNIFNLSQAGTIEDYGAYKAVRALTSLTDITYDGETARFDFDAGRVYYQGDMVSDALPWLISLSYTLDGQENSPENLAGASGHIEIAIDIAKNEAVAGDWYDNLMCQVTLTLPCETCVNILAPNAVSANAGEDRTLAFSALPGQGLKARVSFDAESFEMAGVSIAALPFAMDFALPDISGYTSQIASLGTTIASVAASAEEAGTAASALKTKATSLTGVLDTAETNALKEKAGAMKANLDADAAALIDELTAALADAEAALDASRTAAQELSDGLTALDQQLFSMRMTTAVLARGTSDLPNQITAMTDSILAGYDYSDYRPTSFTDARNGQVALLQFVMTTAPIRVAQETPAPAAEAEDTFFTRLMKLFQ